VKQYLFIGVAVVRIRRFDDDLTLASRARRPRVGALVGIEQPVEDSNPEVEGADGDPFIDPWNNAEKSRSSGSNIGVKP
jgi:hypothetical protein